MLNRHRKVFVILLAVGMLASACQRSVFSETREYDMSSIETTVSDAVTDDDTLTGNSAEEESVSMENLPFKLIIDDDLLVVDHGKDKASVYRATVGKKTTTWMGNDTWMVAPLSIDWCIGKTVWSDDFRHDGEGDDVTYSIISRDLALENIGSAHELSLNEIASLSDFPQTYCDYSSGKSVLAWDYTLEGYPWEYYDGVDWFTMSTDVDSVEYILMTPYLDGIPLSSGRGTGDFPTIEWAGVIEPAGYGNFSGWAYDYMNSDNQFIALTSFDYQITETILKDQDIIPAKDCLNSISTAFAYDTRQISGKTIEVYCMELRYLIADEFPLCFVDGKEEYVLIPIWTAHAKIYDDSSVTIGTTSINAITGESIFSQTVGPDDPRYYSELGVTA